ncbi:hypothetical protein FRB98_008842, partial [Tulasnella sp. 332]
MALGSLRMVLNTLPIPDPFKSAVTAVPTIALTLMQVSQAVKTNKKDVREFTLYIGQLTDATLRPLQYVDRRPICPEMENAVAEFHEHVHVHVNDGIVTLKPFNCPFRELKHILKDMEKLTARSRWRRIAGYRSDPIKIVASKQRLQQVVEIIKVGTMLATQATVESTKGAVRELHPVVEATHTEVINIRTQFQDGEIQLLLDHLGTGDSGASGIAMDGEERKCLDGTRQAVLAKIELWIRQPEYAEKHIMWLKAVAGCGKSSIAGTVEKRAKASDLLGARFYFARAKPTRNQCAILELSRQLASRPEGQLRTSIVAAVKAEPDIAHSTVTYQYLKLIHEPLLTLNNTASKLIIVPDGVDECEEKYASKLLELIGRDHHQLPVGVKFFVTSRIMPHIWCEMESDSVSPTVEHLSLDVEGSSGVDMDIALYFKERLPALIRRYKIKDRDWPGESKRNELVRMSNKLFIWAATSALLLADPNSRDPVTQLERLLSTLSLANLDDLYSLALDRAFPSTVTTSILPLLRSVLGTLVVARTPVNVMTLATLLTSGTGSPRHLAGDIHVKVLSWLQMVLMLPDGDDTPHAGPVRFLHQSFVDFLVTKDRCDDRFLLSIPKHHKQMTIRCLRCMSDLQHNICRLTDPSKLNSEVDHLPARIERYISPALGYACLYWPEHLSRTQTDSKERLKIDAFLEDSVRHRLLHWIEVLSFLGKTKEAVLLVRFTEVWVKARESYITLDSSLSPLLYDARRFLLEFMDPISTSSLNIYSSALGFTPSSANLATYYRHMLSGGPKVLRSRNVKWSNTLWVGSKHSSAINCLAWSPCGKVLASGSDDAMICLWDEEACGMVSGPLVGHIGKVVCLAWSPSEKILASGSEDTTLRLWEVDTGVSVGRPLVGHTEGIRCIPWSPNGQVLASGSSDTTLCLWDAKTGTAVGGLLEGHTESVSCLAYSPCGKVLASGSWDCTVRLWDLDAMAAVDGALNRHTHMVLCLAWSPHAQVIASGSEDTTICLWDAKTSAAIGGPLRGHAVAVSCLAWSPSGRTLASGSYDHTFRLWDPETGTAVGELTVGCAGSCLAWSPSGKTLAFSCHDHTVNLWEADTGATVGRLLSGHTSYVCCLAWSPSGKVLVSGSNDTSLRLWDAEAGVTGGEPVLEGHTEEVMCMAWSNDGTMLASGSEDANLRLWYAETGVAVCGPLEGHEAWILCLAWSPCVKVLASGSLDYTIRLWSAEAGASVGRPWEGHTNGVTCLAWSPDGRVLASGSHDRTVLLWEAEIGTCLCRLSEGLANAKYLSWSPDGKVIASKSWEKIIYFWDVETMKAIGGPFPDVDRSLTWSTNG